MRLLATFLCLILVVKVSLSADTLDSDIKNVDIDMFIDLTSHLAQVTSTIKLTNEGTRSPDAFHFALDPYNGAKLSFIGAKVSRLIIFKLNFLFICLFVVCWFVCRKWKKMLT